MKRILVIGDTIKDVYVRGSIIGISAETPTLVMKKEKTSVYNGGASLVAAHIKKINGACVLYDHQPIVTKTRFFVDGYKLFQTDEFHENGIFNVDDIISDIDTFADTVVVADNRHGSIDYRVASSIVKACKNKNIDLFVDSQVSQNTSNHKWYAGAKTVFLNEKELKSLGLYGYLEWDLKQIQEHFNWTNIIVKLGERGSVALIGDKYIKTPGVKVDAIDTCGAGDAFMAVIVSRDKIDEETLRFANEYAANTCTYVGTGINS